MTILMSLSMANRAVGKELNETFGQWADFIGSTIEVGQWADLYRVRQDINGQSEFLKYGTVGENNVLL